MKVRILGSGSSGGVPRLGIGWGACDPKEPRNRRSRCSVLFSNAGKNVLIDTSPDMREQLLAADAHRLEAVFYTHLHADQAHGIDDLRGLVLATRNRVPVYAEPDILAEFKDRFAYCFRKVRDYPPILDARDLTGTVEEAGMTITPVRVQHGTIPATGYRVGDVGYFPDVSDISDDAMDKLKGLSLLIMDALRYRPHPTHSHLDQALEWIDHLKPDRAIVTNLHSDLDYKTLTYTLPSNVEPAYDGMEIDLPGS